MTSNGNLTDELPMPPYPVRIPASFADDTPFAELPLGVQRMILRVLEAEGG